METRQFDTEYINTEFQKLSSALSKEVEFYITGGFVMALLELKAGTKDIDVVTTNKQESHTLTNALRRLDYCPLRAETLKGAYRSMSAECWQNADKFQWDIFTQRIADKLTLSLEMINRAHEYIHKGKLRAYVLSKEDVFLLKGVTDRDRDLDDMSLLAQSGIKYDVVFGECEKQTEATERLWEPALLERIEDLEAQYNVKIPFKNKLIESADESLLFHYVKDQTKDGPIPADKIIADLVKQGIKESDIMPTIGSLVGKKRIKILKNNLVALA